MRIRFLVLNYFLCLFSWLAKIVFFPGPLGHVPVCFILCLTNLLNFIVLLTLITSRWTKRSAENHQLVMLTNWITMMASDRWNTIISPSLFFKINWHLSNEVDISLQIFKKFLKFGFIERNKIELYRICCRIELWFSNHYLI